MPDVSAVVVNGSNTVTGTAIRPANYRADDILIRLARLADEDEETYLLG